MPFLPLDRTVAPEVLQKILHDPMLLQQLGDRVYELLQEDLRQQAERRRGCGRHL
ncbi:hypothetical protein [Altericista sp. CCNU0014]|uniref:hypothetical protein n=1 Tax=Altericista sp. CCNU0014 TaxID=3082949 RepID=UPI00384ACED7